MTDDVTTVAPFTLFEPNTILDVVNDPNPATGAYEMRLLKNGSETPIKLFSTAMSPLTAGRIAVGPISLGVGQYIWTRRPTAAVVVANSMIVKYARPIA